LNGSCGSAFIRKKVIDAITNRVSTA